jgi:hypothetical protein
VKVLTCAVFPRSFALTETLLYSPRQRPRTALRSIRVHRSRERDCSDPHRRHPRMRCVRRVVSPVSLPVRGQEALEVCFFHHLLTRVHPCSTESVQCDRCKHFYHMSCVSPPLLAKPTKGYGWKCGSCGQPDDRSAGGSDTRSGTPATSNMANTNTNMNMNGTKTRGAAQPKTPVQSVRPRGRPRKDRVQAELEQNMEIKTFKGWPFRYFG